MKLRRTLVLLLVAALCQRSLPAVADGLIRDGVGPISTGRGGTNQGFADNSAIIMDNPGAMMNVDGCGLAEIGADTSVCIVDYSNPFNDVQSHKRPIPMPVLGFVEKSADGRWAYGLGAFAPAGFGASYGDLINPVVGPTKYSSIGGLGKILPALAYRVNDQLSIGGTVGLAFSDVELKGPVFVQNGPLTGLPSIQELQGFGVATTGSVGMQYRWNEKTMIGATYTEQVDMYLRGNAQTVLFPGFPLPSDFDSKIHLKWPRSLAVGFKHDLCPHRRVSADVIWYDWSSAFDSLEITYNNPTNPLVPVLLSGAGVTLPLTDSLPLRWQDSVAMRLGYEFDTNETDTWRAGYDYHGSPVPNETLSPFLDGILVHAFSLGYSHKFSQVTFNAAYQYNFSHTRNVGVSEIVGGDFNNSQMRAQAHFAMFSLLWPY